MEKSGFQTGDLGQLPNQPPQYSPYPNQPQPGPCVTPYPQPQPQPEPVQQITVVQQIAAPVVGPNPAMLVCPSCRQSIQTRVEHEPSSKTHIMALLMCLVGCWLCCCIPYCSDDCQDARHLCPSCGAYIGTHSN